MKALFVLLVGSAVGALFVWPVRPHTAPLPDAGETSCKGGCAAVSLPETELTREHTTHLLQALARKPAGTDCPELDELLFYGQAADGSSLSPEWRAFLDRELGRKTVTLSVRIGEPARIELTRTIPLDVRTHLHADRADGVVPPEITLTVKRVGLDHLWTRI